jgi:tetratricopeptide (TPR) repeat protein
MGRLRETAGDLARRESRPAAALQAYRDALSIYEKKYEPGSTVNLLALCGLGEAELDSGRPAAAVAPLERALALAADPGVPAPTRGRVRFALARALALAPGPGARGAADDRRARARALAAEAEADYAAGGDDGARREVAAWRTARR